LIAFFVARRNANKKQEDIRRRKEAQNPQVAQKSAQRSSKKGSKKSQSKKDLPTAQAELGEDLVAEKLLEDDAPEDNFVVSSTGSIFDDEEFFPDEDDVPVADSPVESVKATTAQYEEPLPPADFVEDDDAVDLASL